MSASREQRLLLKLRWLREERTASLEERQKYVYDIHRALGYIQSRVPAAPAKESQANAPPTAPPQETDASGAIVHAGDVEAAGTKVDPELKRVFREITKKTHPDVIYHDKNISDAQKDHLTSLFMKARAAFETQDSQTLFEIALDLDIDIAKSSNAVLEILESATKKIEDELSTIKESIAWVWGSNHGNHALRMRILEYACRTSNIGTSIDQNIILEAIKFCEGELNFDTTDRLGRTVHVSTRPQSFSGRPAGNPLQEMLKRKSGNK